MWVRSLGQEDPLEKGMTTHSSILLGRMGLHKLDTTEVTYHALSDSFNFWSLHILKELVYSSV